MKARPVLASLLATLSAAARQRGLTDTAWAAAAGVRKETLSRLRSRQSCDLATLEMLAQAVGLDIGVVTAAASTDSFSEHFPRHMKRDDEERLLRFTVSGNLEPGAWKKHGPAFFMAGVAVTLASLREFDRQSLLELAERLHPGSSSVAAYSHWLAGTPLQPCRFLPQLRERLQRAA